MRNFTLFFVVMALLVITGCQPSVSEVSTAIAKTRAAQPTSTFTPEPTNTPTLTPSPTPTSTITSTPTPEFLQFFTENFELASDSWSFFVIPAPFIYGSYRPSNLLVQGLVEEFIPGIQDGFLRFELHAKELFASAYYNRFTYDDVRIDARVSNIQGNGNFLGLICRYDPNVGWYEASLGDSGLYWVNAVKISDSNKINRILLVTGGTGIIKGGQAENEISLVCQENTLSLLINGKLINQIPVESIGFTSGYSGVSVHTLSRWVILDQRLKFNRKLPVIANFDWVKFSAP
jgi:hypothetical protein